MAHDMTPALARRVGVGGTFARAASDLIESRKSFPDAGRI